MVLEGVMLRSFDLVMEAISVKRSNHLDRKRYCDSSHNRLKGQSAQLGIEGCGSLIHDGTKRNCLSKRIWQPGCSGNGPR